MNFKNLFHTMAMFCAAVVFGMGTFTSTTFAGSTVSITSDTAVLLSGSGIPLFLAGSSTLVSYSASATTLTVVLDAGSNVTVKSNNLYTLTNSQSLPTQCSASPAYSYVTFTATGPTTITITPTTAVACS